MAEPNGIRASLASLKCCSPNGIPIIVIHSPAPSNTCSIAIGSPVMTIHRIFNRSEPAPPPYSTSFPNGKKLSDANLKHCMPTGMPTIVIHHRQPARHQLSPLIAPPNINHSKFPRHPIPLPPKFYLHSKLIRPHPVSV